MSKAPYRATMFRYAIEQEPDEFDTYDDLMGFVHGCVEYNLAAPYKIETPDGVTEGRACYDLLRAWEKRAWHH